MKHMRLDLVCGRCSAGCSPSAFTHFKSSQECKWARRTLYTELSLSKGPSGGLLIVDGGTYELWKSLWREDINLEDGAGG